MEINSNRNEKILSVQALRALAFLGIFLSHARASVFKWPALGVSVFFVLSGYLMYYHYGCLEMPCSTKDNLLFSQSKVKKLYPLHIITMSFAVLLDLVCAAYKGLTVKHIIGLIGKIGLNITLLQSWVPYIYINVSLNGVAWYLSTSVFLYFMFPFLKKWIKGIDSKKIVIICISILILEVVVCIPWIILLGANSPVYMWFAYSFPVFRLGDFFIGCCLGKYFSNDKLPDSTPLKATLCEAVATLLTVIVYVWTEQSSENPVLLAAKNWTTPYIPLAVIWIMLFIWNKGMITRLLTNRFTIYVGNISAYAFLIHYVFAEYFNQILSFLNIELSYSENIVKIIIELFLSIGTSVAYQKMKERYDMKKTKRISKA